MASHPLSRSVLICLALTISAIRLHSHSLGTPTAVGQELNRCLAVVRVATSRRGENKGKTPAVVALSGRVFAPAIASRAA